MDISLSGLDEKERQKQNKCDPSGNRCMRYFYHSMRHCLARAELRPLFAKQERDDAVKTTLPKRPLNAEPDAHLFGNTGRNVGNPRNGMSQKMMRTGHRKGR
ncbi:MAG: hypothetical protein Q4P24_09775 [Rhodobacterales bacterium]|nr:hypothetical protein [Rhodobacterales bacterium]